MCVCRSAELLDRAGVELCAPFLTSPQIQATNLTSIHETANSLWGFCHSGRYFPWRLYCREDFSPVRWGHECYRPPPARNGCAQRRSSGFDAGKVLGAVADQYRQKLSGYRHKLEELESRHGISTDAFLQRFEAGDLAMPTSGSIGRTSPP